MTEKPIETNTNLVVNGSFETYEDWTYHKPDNALIGEDYWQGVLTPFMALKDEASIRQTLTAPLEQAADARFQLRLLYENRYVSACSVVIVKQGSDEKLEIDLPARDSMSEPLALNLTLLECDLPASFALTAKALFDVSVISAKKLPGDVASAELRVTGIILQIHFPAAEVLEIINDEQHHSPDDILALCLGAVDENRQVVRFAVKPSTSWAKSEACVMLEDNLLDAVTTEPVQGKAQPTLAEWLFNSESTPDAGPHELKLCLYSKYTSTPFSMRASLGHHRLKLVCLRGAETVPVVGLGQGVVLELQARSHYTDEPVETEVTWHGEGQEVLHRSFTDAQGRASYTFLPTQGGTFTITASAGSLYYQRGKVTLDYLVVAVDEDPWKTVLAAFDQGTAAVWGSRQGYPNRGSVFLIKTVFPPYLAGASVSMTAAQGDAPEDLDVVPDIPFGESQPIIASNAQWLWQCGDKRNGTIGAVLHCSKLQHPSPVNVMSLARNTLKIGQTRIINPSPVRDSGGVVHCLVQILTLDEKPASDIKVDWSLKDKTKSSHTSAQGWASFSDQPMNAEAYDVVARINVRDDAEPLEQVYPISPLATHVFSQYTFMLDDEEIDPGLLGVICQPGATHEFKMVPKSTLPETLLTVEWLGDLLGLVFHPELPRVKPIPAAGFAWHIQAGSAVRGFGGLKFIFYWGGEAFLPVRVVAGSLAEEAQFTLEHSGAISPTLYPCHGALHELSLRTTSMALLGLPAQLLASTLPPEVVIDRDTAPVIGAAGVRWLLDCQASRTDAEFGLEAKVDVGTGTLTTQAALNLGDHKLDIADFHAPAYDPVISESEPAHMQMRVCSAFTKEWVAGKRVHWQQGTGEPQTALTDAQGTAKYTVVPLEPGPGLVRGFVKNPFDNSVRSEGFAFIALAYSPWSSLLVEDSHRPPQPWSESVMRPRRGRRFDFRLSTNGAAEWIGQSVAIGMIGNRPSETGLKMTEGTLGEYRPMQEQGLDFSLVANGAQDRTLSFRLATARLLKQSPVQVMSLGDTASVVGLAAISKASQLASWREELSFEVRLINVLNGKSVARQSIQWEGAGFDPVVTFSSVRGIASLRFTPAFAGPGSLTARVVGGDTAAFIRFSYEVLEPCRIEGLSASLSSGYPGQAFTARLRVVGLWSGKPQMGVIVQWRFASEARSSVTDEDGLSHEGFVLPFLVEDQMLSAWVAGGENRPAVDRLVITVMQDRYSLDSPVFPDDPVDEGEEVELSVKVMSENTAGTVANVPVGWRLQDQTTVTSQSGEDGRAILIHRWTYANRVHNIRASLSTFDGSVPYLDMVVKDSARNLWTKNVQLSMHGRSLSSRVWITRGADHTLQLSVEGKSQLTGTLVSLVIESELGGVAVEPSSSRILTPQGLNWKISCIGTIPKHECRVLLRSEKFPGRDSVLIGEVGDHKARIAEFKELRMSESNGIRTYHSEVRFESVFTGRALLQEHVSIDFSPGGSGSYSEITDSGGWAKHAFRLPADVRTAWVTLSRANLFDNSGSASKTLNWPMGIVKEIHSEETGNN
jgi:hypothetical protein